MINESELTGCVRKSLDDYFRHLDGEKPSAIYDMVVSHVEKPLLEYILNYAQGNQTKAADLLGLNRNTLRKKMKEHGIQ
ncbi:MAG: Fis family transcriptional regulator [Sulfuricella sp.]|nr:Fis family transcriptional regulator [Sulfuricella sp.]